MKFRITFKSPDGVSDSISMATDAEIEAIEFKRDEPLSEEDVESMRSDIRDSLFESSRKWISHSEYVTIEIDTVLDTCVVVRPGK